MPITSNSVLPTLVTLIPMLTSVLTPYLKSATVALPMLSLLLSKAQGHKTFLKTILTLSCWYLLDSSHHVLSDEYPCAKVPIIFQIFASFCIGQISNQQHKAMIRVKEFSSTHFLAKDSASRFSVSSSLTGSMLLRLLCVLPPLPSPPSSSGST